MRIACRLCNGVATSGFPWRLTVDRVGHCCHLAVFGIVALLVSQATASLPLCGGRVQGFAAGDRAGCFCRLRHSGQEVCVDSFGDDLTITKMPYMFNGSHIGGDFGCHLTRDGSYAFTGIFSCYDGELVGFCNSDDSLPCCAATNCTACGTVYNQCDDAPTTTLSTTATTRLIATTSQPSTSASSVTTTFLSPAALAESRTTSDKAQTSAEQSTNDGSILLPTLIGIAVFLLLVLLGVVVLHVRRKQRGNNNATTSEQVEQVRPVDTSMSVLGNAASQQYVVAVADVASGNNVYVDIPLQANQRLYGQRPHCKTDDHYCATVEVAIQGDQDRGGD